MMSAIREWLDHLVILTNADDEQELLRAQQRHIELLNARLDEVHRKRKPPATEGQPSDA